MSAASSLYDQLGGEPALRAIIAEFVQRMFDDVMIGFHFRGVTQARIKELEFQHAAAFLGGPHEYRGRPLADAHKKHRIMGGQFDRRATILREVLAAHGAPAHVAAAWLEHVESLRDQITAQGSGQCND